MEEVRLGITRLVRRHCFPFRTKLSPRENVSLACLVPIRLGLATPLTTTTALQSACIVLLNILLLR